jgi:hypothetical protein
MSASAALIGAMLGGMLPLTAAQEATPLAGRQAAIVATYTLPEIALAAMQNEALPEHAIVDDLGMLLGGVGSDLWHGPEDPANAFWMVTDRGPNGEIDVEVDGEEVTRRTFPVPDFTPLILHVRADGDALTVLEAIPVVNQEGEPVTGLSNMAKADETPFDKDAEVELALNPDGLDPEGLVRTADGEFWLAEEYRPSLVKVDATGTVVARYVPGGVELAGAGYPVEATLPAIYAKRKGNRGFEGLALSGDGGTLYALLQSPLLNPDRDTGNASRVGRILAVDVATGEPVAEYAYVFEDAATFACGDDPCEASDMKLSGLVWQDEATLLVLERTDDEARLYTVDLTDATNILGTAWSSPVALPSLESQTDPAAVGVMPVAKTLLVNLNELPGMPGKIEGVAAIDESTVAVVNDNDFNIDALYDEDSELKRSQVLVVELP